MIHQIIKQHRIGNQIRKKHKKKPQILPKNLPKNDDFYLLYALNNSIQINYKIQKFKSQYKYKPKIMSIYSSFFTPQTISILLCLHQVTKQGEEVDPRNPIIQFLMKKILKITQQANIQTTNDGFQAQMFSVINDIQFMDQYRQNLGQIDNFNIFYRQLSTILKTLRSLRNSKLQQGNVIDFLVRRLYIYFQKLDFKQIVSIYQNFCAYRQGQPYKMRQNEFMLTKSIQQVKFNLQNYKIKQNPQQINRILNDLAQTDHTFKTSYIKGLYKSQQSKPNESMHQLHRYFDKCLGNLFQQKTQTAPMSNKINHCIVSTAYSSLKLGQLQQCLQSISQGLRISQNNSDQQSINNCIIYLYKIAQQLGKYQQQILLAQHAITHSLNLSNITLMVYSCLCYSAFEKKYNCQNTEVALLKSRHINWTDALHFSKKKIYSNFQSNCKNIYHSFRSLLIPTFLHKLSILIHLPQLKSLLLNPYYTRQQLLDLEVYQQFQAKNSNLDSQLKKAKRYYNTNQKVFLQKSLHKLLVLQKQARSPEDIVKIKKFLCYLKVQSGVQMDSYRSVQQLILTCNKYGFVKSYKVKSLNFINKLLLKNQMYYDSLVKIQQTIKFCQQNQLVEQRIISSLLKAEALCSVQNLFQALQIVQEIQQQGIIQKLSSQNLSVFWETKVLIFKKFISTLESDINFLHESNQLKRVHFECLKNLFRCYLILQNLQKIKRVIKQHQDFIILNPLLVQNKQSVQLKLRKILAYLQKVESVYKNIEGNSANQQQQFDQEFIHKKIIKKIQSIYFQ